jgi:hypothetical protein
METGDFLGIKGLLGNLEAGVGFVIIPDNLDVDEYKKDVYQTGRVSINGGYGHSNFYNILVDREVIQRIKFPKKAGELGSPVVWLNIPKHNEPIVIACLKYDEDYFSISENRRRLTETYKDNIVDLDLDAKNGRIKISGSSFNKPFEFDINVGGVDSVFKIQVNGSILSKSAGKTILVSEEKITTLVTDKSGIVKSRVQITKDEVNIKSDSITHSEGKQPMVLGDTLVKLLEDILSEINKIRVPTPVGPSGTPLNKTKFEDLSKRVEEIKSKISKLD